MVYFKNLCLLIISLTLVSCEGGSSCSGNQSSPVDEYISFSADFEGNNTLTYNDNEYSSGCDAELITTHKTDPNYQPQIQEIMTEQHNGNGTQHSIKFDDKFSRITFVKSSQFVKFSPTHTFHFWIKPTMKGHLANVGVNSISIVDDKIKIDWGDGIKSLSADITMNTWQHIAIVDDKIKIDWGDGIKSLSADITMNTWQHIAIVDDTQNIKLIVNGVATSTLKVASTHQNVMRIGSDNFRGNVDKINFTNEVLSEEDITNIYENTKAEYEILNDALGN